MTITTLLFCPFAACSHSQAPLNQSGAWFAPFIDRNRYRTMLTLSRTLPAPRHALTVLAMLLFSIIAPLAQAADFLLQNTNFESGYTLGQLTTDATGTTAGQGGWFTETTGTGGAANWNVVADPVSGGSHGNVLATQAGNTASGNNVTRNAWTNDVATNMASNPASNDVFKITYDFFMGGTSSTSTNRYGLYMYDSTGTKILAGATMQNNTGQFYGVSYYNNSGTVGNYSFNTNLGTGSNPPLLSRNTWYTFLVTFNKTTGRFEAGFSTDGGTNFRWYYVDGAAAGTNPGELDTIGTVNSGTAAQGSTLGYYDNIHMISTSIAVPEPSTYAMSGLCVLILGALAKRRKAA